MANHWEYSSDSEGSTDDEGDLDVSLQVAILVIGRSGSGKSYLTRSLIKQFGREGKKTYVVNDRTPDKRYHKIEWHQIPALRDCSLIVEDVINAKPPQFAMLLEVLNYKNHHDRVSPVIAIGHALHKTNLHGLVPFFKFIYVSTLKTNIFSFRSLLNYYCYEPEERKEYIAKFLAADQNFSFFMFDVDNRKIRLTRAEEEVIRDDENQRLRRLQEEVEAPKRNFATARTSAKNYLSRMRHNSDYAEMLFSLIYPSLPLNRYEPENLTVTLHKGDETVVISLIDYIASLLDETQTEPERAMMQFHRYLKRQRGLHLPRALVLNKTLW
jgi:hypothetical protein